MIPFAAALWKHNWGGYSLWGTGNRTNAWQMVRRRAKAAGITTEVRNHTFAAPASRPTSRTVALSRRPARWRLYDQREDRVTPKRLGVLHELIPHAKTIAVLINSDIAPTFPRHSPPRFGRSSSRWLGISDLKRMPLAILVGIGGRSTAIAPRSGAAPTGLGRFLGNLPSPFRAKRLRASLAATLPEPLRSLVLPIIVRGVRIARDGREHIVLPVFGSLRHAHDPMKAYRACLPLGIELYFICA
jgi:hypothetical protein